MIGSEAVEHFDRQGRTVPGVDNNMRRGFFGPAGDTAITRTLDHIFLEIVEAESRVQRAAVSS